MTLLEKAQDYLKRTKGTTNFTATIREFDNLITIRKGNQKKVYGYLEVKDGNIKAFLKA